MHSVLCYPISYNIILLDIPRLGLHIPYEKEDSSSHVARNKLIPIVLKTIRVINSGSQDPLMGSYVPAICGERVALKTCLIARDSSSLCCYNYTKH